MAEREKSVKKKASSTPRESMFVPTPPDGGWGWVVVFSSFMISVLVDGTCFSQGIFFNEFMESFNANTATTSWIGSVLNGTYLTIGPFVSMLVNKYGCQRIAITGACISSVSFFASTYAPNIIAFTFMYGFFGGLGFGFMYLPAIVMVGYYFDRRRALATGIACCGSGIGMFVFAPLSEFLIGEYTWRGTTWIMSGLILNGAIFSMFYRPIPVGKPERLPEEVPSMPVPEDRIIYSKVSLEQGALQMNNNTDDAMSPITRCRSFEMNLHKPTSSRHSHAVRERNNLIRLTQSHGSLLKEEHRYLSPMVRKDVFYSGSLHNLKEYTEAQSSRQFIKAMMGSTSTVDEQKRTGCARVGHAILSVFDLTLLKSPTFLLYCFSCFLCMLGFFVPFTYIPPLAVQLGISSKEAAFLISIIGITNTVGRVLVGFVSDQSWADCLLINNIALMIGGAVTMLVPFYGNYGLLATYVAIFGLGIAVFVSLRSIIMVELMGLERLTSAFGLVIMFQGMSSYIGAPIAGSIADYFGNYNAAFYLSGAALAMSGVICLPLRRLSEWEKRRQKTYGTVQENETMFQDIGTIS